MRWGTIRGYKSSKYKHVRCVKIEGEIKFIARFYRKERGRTNTKIYDSEREAAIAVDKYNLKYGKQPVNILKRKEK